MSYLHCPACQHAFNLVRDPVCPRCAAAARAKHIDVVDLTADLTADLRVEPDAASSSRRTADLVVAAAAFARALRRATPAERDAARASLGLVRASLAPPRFALLRAPSLLAAAVSSLLGVL